MSVDLANKEAVFQLKASLYTITTLHLLENELAELDNQLSKLHKQAPKFFNSAPVIIDLQRLNPECLANNFDFSKLRQILMAQELIVVGLRHVPDAWVDKAKAAGFALLPNATAKGGAHSRELPSAKPLEMVEPTIAEKPEEVTAAAPAESLIITTQVRSGQQIYAKDADLIIIQSVSPGAEVIADGSIHIYGALKGRALAGAKGNTKARIFCQALGAELISIAGHYWLYEDLMAEMRTQGAVQIFLKNEKLQLARL